MINPAEPTGNRTFGSRAGLGGFAAYPTPDLAGPWIGCPGYFLTTLNTSSTAPTVRFTRSMMSADVIWIVKRM